VKILGIYTNFIADCICLSIRLYFHNENVSTNKSRAKGAASITESRIGYQPIVDHSAFMIADEKEVIENRSCTLLSSGDQRVRVS